MSSHAHEHKHHVTSLGTLVATFAALVALTFLTSAMAHVHLGRADIWITLGIATVKAALVAMIFMHLGHDKAINGIILMVTLLFATIFIAFTLMDAEQYEYQIDEYVEAEKQPPPTWRPSRGPRDPRRKQSPSRSATPVREVVGKGAQGPIPLQNAPFAASPRRV